MRRRRPAGCPGDREALLSGRDVFRIGVARRPAPPAGVRAATHEHDTHMTTGTTSATGRLDHQGSRPRTGSGGGPGWWAAIRPWGAIRIAVLAGLFVWLFWGHLYRLWVLWQEPDWSHGYLIPLFCLYMVNTRRKELLAEGHAGSILGLPALLISLAVYVLSIVYKIGYPQQLALVSTIAIVLV